jgi:hypothetical protein
MPIIGLGRGMVKIMPYNPDFIWPVSPEKRNQQ